LNYLPDVEGNLILNARFIGGFLFAFFVYALMYVLLNVGLRFEVSTLTSGYFVKGLAGFMAAVIGITTSVAILSTPQYKYKQMAQAAFKGSAIFGSIGFIAGFIGPMIISPDANQGPLMGIFLTGPLGAFMGLVFGGIWWFIRRTK